MISEAKYEKLKGLAAGTGVNVAIALLSDEVLLTKNGKDLFNGPYPEAVDFLIDLNIDLTGAAADLESAWAESGYNPSGEVLDEG